MGKGEALKAEMVQTILKQFDAEVELAIPRLLAGRPRQTELYIYAWKVEKLDPWDALEYVVERNMVASARCLQSDLHYPSDIQARHGALQRYVALGDHLSWPSDSQRLTTLLLSSQSEADDVEATSLLSSQSGVKTHKRPPKLHVVEPEPIMQQALRRVFERSGFGLQAQLDNLRNFVMHLGTAKGNWGEWKFCGLMLELGRQNSAEKGNPTSIYQFFLSKTSEKLVLPDDYKNLTSVATEIQSGVDVLTEEYPYPTKITVNVITSARVDVIGWLVSLDDAKTIDDDKMPTLHLMTCAAKVYQILTCKTFADNILSSRADWWVVLCLPE